MSLKHKLKICKNKHEPIVLAAAPIGQQRVFTAIMLALITLL
jgi:hypothetical protein